VLIMGLGKPLTYWGEPFLDALMERGYHVITFDNRDAGLPASSAMSFSV
jgi:hypothetical protein